MPKFGLSKDHSSLLSSINSDISLNDSSTHGSLTDVFELRNLPKELKEIDLESNLEAFLKDAAKARTSSFKDLEEKCDPGNKTEVKQKDVSTKAANKMLSPAESISSMPSPVCEFRLLKKEQEKSSLDSKEAEKCRVVKKISSEARLKSDEKKEIKTKENKSKSNKMDGSNSFDKKTVKCKDVNHPTKTVNNESITMQNSDQVHCSASAKAALVSKQKKVPKATAENSRSREKGENVQRQKKKASSSSQPEYTEQKSISLEKSIEIAVGMEFDKLRKLIYDQRIILNREFLQLQETANKQQETTEALCGLVENLVHVNAMLMLELKTKILNN